jgi:probable phosphoglycerate mutase
MINHLLSRKTLLNQYYAMRHGHSEANAAGIIVSDPALGVDQYGLTTKGRRQVERTLFDFRDLDESAILVSSDFKRARETANLVFQALGNESGITFDARLRERSFGDLDLEPDSNYRSVWHRDRLDPAHTDRNVESANYVMERATALIVDLEKRYQKQKILLVGHGDILQILQTAFAGEDASSHREQMHIETAEIRVLKFKSANSEIFSEPY